MNLEKRIDVLEAKAGHLGPDRVDLIVLSGLEADGKQHDFNYYWSAWSPQGFIQLRDSESQAEFRQRAETVFRGVTLGRIGRCVGSADTYGMPADLPRLDLEPAGV